ncbi:hypothetical protein [Hirschia baltica]|uniref:Uncharacterized protein n=1 Tax=Hirschia baltica (strain ATCC 49814 / DSM 5838 / IFAM 1418) TaxID=582402 RepID=C6XP80_HIRBI|nr:hypothetical protein [Hirschia baltica]ACT60260.1 putative exported protein of unknown function [Hirschia baltica ATCC 49814]
MAIDGRWELTAQTPMGAQVSVAEFSVEGDVLGGGQSGAQGGGDITSGKISGNQVSWQTKVSVPLPITLEFTGEFEGDKISGNVKAGAFGSFPFSGVRCT